MKTLKLTLIIFIAITSISQASVTGYDKSHRLTRGTHTTNSDNSSNSKEILILHEAAHVVQNAQTDLNSSTAGTSMMPLKQQVSSSNQQLKPTIKKDHQFICLPGEKDPITSAFKP